MACKNCNCKKPGKLSIFWKKFKNIFNSYGQKVDVKTAAILLVKNGQIYLKDLSYLLMLDIGNFPVARWKKTRVSKLEL